MPPQAMAASSQNQSVPRRLLSWTLPGRLPESRQPEQSQPQAGSQIKEARQHPGAEIPDQQFRQGGAEAEQDRGQQGFSGATIHFHIAVRRG